jgi:hypothetical protein
MDYNFTKATKEVFDKKLDVLIESWLNGNRIKVAAQLRMWGLPAVVLFCKKLAEIKDTEEYQDINCLAILLDMKEKSNER